MQKLTTYSWSDYYRGELGEAAIRSSFAAVDGFRVSRYCYPAGTVLNGSMGKCVCFVLRGSCRFVFDQGQEIELDASRFVELPRGEYELSVGNIDELEFVAVWELPKTMTPD